MNAADALRVHHAIHDDDEWATLSDGSRWPIVTTKEGVRRCVVRGFPIMEQNIKKPSEWSTKARLGHRISWILAPGRWGRIEDDRIAAKCSAILPDDLAPAPAPAPTPAPAPAPAPTTTPTTTTTTTTTAAAGTLDDPTVSVALDDGTALTSATLDDGLDATMTSTSTTMTATTTTSTTGASARKRRLCMVDDTAEPEDAKRQRLSAYLATASPSNHIVCMRVSLSLMQSTDEYNAYHTDSRRYQIDVEFLPYWRTPLTREDRVVLREQDTEYQRVAALFEGTIDADHARQHKYKRLEIIKITRLQVCLSLSLSLSLSLARSCT